MDSSKNISGQHTGTSKDLLYVVKIGGNIIDDDEKLFSFLEVFASVKGKKILVHGGGKLATKLAEQMGIEQKLVDGRRITDAETLKVVTMVYGGYINKMIVAKLQALNCNAIGLSGADANIISAHKRIHPTIDYGFVGDIDSVNAGFLQNILEQNISIVLAPLTHDQKGQILNTNADTIAQEVAKALGNMYNVHLIYSFEKSGVLMNAEDDSSVIKKISPASYKELKAQQVIFAGMIPKLDNAFAAISSGVKRVVIGKAEELPLLITGQSGTSIEHD